MVIGYTSGVFDLFHIGHLNLLFKARGLCDRLIVGVSTDELCFSAKMKNPVIPFDERKQIVGALKFVDCVVPQDSYDKADQHDRYKFDIMFVGDDWYQDPKWQNYERDFEQKNVRVIYFPYYKGTSSTIINNVLNNIKSNEKI